MIWYTLPMDRPQNYNRCSNQKRYRPGKKDSKMRCRDLHLWRKEALLLLWARVPDKMHPGGSGVICVLHHLLQHRVASLRAALYMEPMIRIVSTPHKKVSLICVAPALGVPNVSSPCRLTDMRFCLLYGPSQGTTAGEPPTYSPKTPNP